MSSAVLYLAIVTVWGVVLVPMWLRRDGDGISRLLHRRHDDPEHEETSPHELSDHESVHDLAHEAGHALRHVAAHEDVEAAEFEVPVKPPHRTRTGHRSRAAVIARRRRRTLGLGLLLVAAVVTVVTAVAPWWFVIPPAVLLAGHLWLLRVAVQIDAARRRELRAAAIRAAHARRAHEERLAREAEVPTAEVIELPASPRDEVYDQYTDRRAVGD
jgi:hypothetical protein